MPEITHCGHTLTWREHSQGEHTLIFIHGFSVNRAVWAREVARMAPHGRCVSLDLPGHYPATAPAGDQRLSQDELLDLELRAISAIAGGRRVTLVGHSTGGLVALAAAALLPETVARVIAIAPVVWGPLSGFLGLYQRLLALPGGYGLFWLNYRAAQLWPRYALWASSFASGDPAAYRRSPLVAEAIGRFHPNSRRTQLRSLAMLLRTLEGCDIRPLAARVACPALVVAGGRDPLVPVEQARWLTAHARSATMLEVPAAGHLPHWEAAEQVERAIDGWLAAHPVAARGEAQGAERYNPLLVLSSLSGKPALRASIPFAHSPTRVEGGSR